ncbi:TetR family transcriptional regulator [Actinoplanes ianthinogenes]|uniref:TetR family transcriptional regulator n=1 Tax=Actinoplanes ianthinogenes TaxID=122358 RepID=A0ABM7LN98_9ACTN|nr:TetR/AcrR family transcriptional regulator [Actinoplanes ianthinogenes]BCJ40748.1 TetR family transcriptional regulator [Actinoplanes ianthinogenes]GGR43157.1 TetR family transcriptional regulator [Actinoplanes ianthinogenes]
MTSTIPTVGQERKAPGRPRNAQADEAILDAVLALMADGQSAAAVSIESVAAKAGVGKATIYRRWPNKEALLIDAVRSMKGPIPEPAGVSVRDDLIALVTANRSSRVQDYGKVTACLLPELMRDEQLRQMHHAVMEPRREVMREILRRGIADGELRPDLNIDLTVLMLSGPGMMHGLFGSATGVSEGELPEALVDALLRGAAA